MIMIPAAAIFPIDCTDPTLVRIFPTFAQLSALSGYLGSFNISKLINVSKRSGSIIYSHQTCERCLTITGMELLLLCHLLVESSFSFTFEGSNKTKDTLLIDN